MNCGYKTHLEESLSSRSSNFRKKSRFWYVLLWLVYVVQVGFQLRQDHPRSFEAISHLHHLEANIQTGAFDEGVS